MSSAYRFRIANSAGECSQDWRIWTEKEEIYVGARTTAHEYKASFHSSGQCHVALSSQIRASLAGDPSWDGKSRLFSKWTIDPLTADTSPQDLVELVFPDSYLDDMSGIPSSSAAVLESQPGTITTVAIILTRLNANATLSSTDLGFSELHRAQLPSGRTVLVIRRQFQETLEYHAYVRTRYWSHYLAKPTKSGRTYGTKPDALTPGGHVMLWDGTQIRKYWHELSMRKLRSLGPPNTVI
jgi:hypothetical protein